MILIAGAGISGLSLAFHLKEQKKPFLLIDSDDVPGGKIQSLSMKRSHYEPQPVQNILTGDVSFGYREETENAIFELGAHSLFADDDVLNFLERAGLKDDIQHCTSAGKNRFIYKDQKFQQLSSSPLDFFLGDFFPWQTKLRILKELFVAKEANPDETFASFVRRRFGDEVLEWIAKPIMYGIHAADPEKLLVADAFPALWKLENEFGSILKGLFFRKKTGRPESISFWNGMQALPLRLEEILKDQIQLNTSLVRMEKSEKGWNCVLKTDQFERWAEFESVVFCMPADSASEILGKSGFPEASAKLAEVCYNPMVVTNMVFEKPGSEYNKTDPTPVGFGGLFPTAAGFKSAGHIWCSRLFSNRFERNYFVVSAFYGGALRPDAFDIDTDMLAADLQRENELLYGIKAESIPVLHRWKQAIPQYDMNRRLAEKASDGLSKEGIHFLANWKGGVGIADCIRNAARLAVQLQRQ